MGKARSQQLDQETSRTFTGSGNHWYALQVRPNHEMAVSIRLRELGVEEYLPMHKASRVVQRNKFNEGPLLFRGYIFSFLNLHAGPRLYRVPGVVRILGFGGCAIPIEDHEVLTTRPDTQGGSLLDMAEGVMFGDENALALCTDQCEVEPDSSCPHGCPSFLRGTGSI